MAFLTQSLNQFAQSPILGLVDQIPSLNVITAQILTTSAATAIQVGSTVKLVDGTGANIIVDVCSAVTDGPVYGVILFNQKKNTYAPGDRVEIACVGSVLYLKTSAAVARGTKVGTTPATTTADPTVQAIATAATDYVTGVALDKATAANQLIRVQIQPSLNGAV